ncbi:MAG: sulfite exporter TauE/SafE family protein [Acidimicrobiales bacterium]
MTIVVAALMGIVAGVLSGLFGIGGGVVIVPGLIFLLRMDSLNAVGTSLAALLLPVGGLAVIRYARDGHVNFTVAFVIAVCLALTAPIGAQIGITLGSRWLTRAFGVFLLVLGARFVLRP